LGRHAARWSSDGRCWGPEFACATIAVPACCRIWARVRFAVSAAKSVSRMRLREAERFSDTACKLLMVDWKRFWIAPSVLRRVETELSAESTRRIVSFAPLTSFTFAVASDFVSLATVAFAEAKPRMPVPVPYFAPLSVKSLFDETVSLPLVVSYEANEPPTTVLI